MSGVPVIAEVERGLTNRAVELEEQFLHGLSARVVCFMGEGPGLGIALDCSRSAAVRPAHPLMRR